jgi:cytosine/adenosine deaminase-related metal-dependent hydrolase
MYLANALGDQGMNEALPDKSIVDTGKKADLVVLDRNPLSLASTPDALTGVNVQMTVASGAVVFEERKVADARRQTEAQAPGAPPEGTAVAERK